MRSKYNLGDKRDRERLERFAILEGVSYAISILGVDMPGDSHLNIVAYEMWKDFHEEYYEKDLGRFVSNYWDGLNIFQDLFVKAFKSFWKGWMDYEQEVW